MTQTMSDRKRVLLLILIMAAVTIGVAWVALFTLYRAAFEQQRERLVETVQSQARLMEAVARFDAQYSTEDIPGGPFAATLVQVRNAHERFAGLGKTGEFTLAKRDGDQIVFLLRQRHTGPENPGRVSFSGDLAEPMRRALSGESGTVDGLDYRGEMVLAAYEPVKEFGMGIVAKIDLAEIQAPFINAIMLAGGVALVLVSLGTAFFRGITNPLLRRIEENERKYRTLFESASEAVFLMTDVFEECNEQACRLWASEREDIVGHSLIEFLPLTQPDGRDSAQEAKDRIEAALSGTPQFFSWQTRRHDGVLIDADISLKAVEVGYRKVIMTTIRDVSERKRLEREILECCAFEQRRIGQDLHDGLGQLLTGVACLSKVLEQTLAAKALPEAARAAEIATLVDQAIAQASNLARGLCPVHLTADGLVTALQELASQVSQLFDVSCRFQCETPILIHDNAVATHLYYIAREAINNALRHGRAKQISMSLTRVHGGITLTVKDDGIGIPAVLQDRKGMGLNIMRYRASMINGILTIEGDADAGTIVACSFEQSR